MNSNNILNKSYISAIAIFFVILYHLHCLFPDCRLFDAFRYLYVGVDLFLFLSAYGLCRSYERHSLGEFYRRRFLRIMPLFVVFASLLSYFHYTHGLQFTIWDWFCNISGLSYYGFGGVRISWYVSALLLFYLVFPLLYMGMKKRGNLFLIIITILCVCMSKFQWIPWYYACSLFRVPIFLYGIYYWFHGSSQKIEFFYLALFCLAVSFSRSGFLLTALFTPLLIRFMKEEVHATPLLTKIMHFIGVNTFELYLANGLTMVLWSINIYQSVLGKILFYFLSQILFFFILKVINMLFARFLYNE